jgi:hypothetical protein
MNTLTILGFAVQGTAILTMVYFGIKNRKTLLK